VAERHWNGRLRTGSAHAGAFKHPDPLFVWPRARVSSVGACGRCCGAALDNMTDSANRHQRRRADALAATTTPSQRGGLSRSQGAGGFARDLQRSAKVKLIALARAALARDRDTGAAWNTRLPRGDSANTSSVYVLAKAAPEKPSAIIAADRAPRRRSFRDPVRARPARPRATHFPRRRRRFALTPKKTPSAGSICGEQVGDNRGCDAGVTGSDPGTVHRGAALDRAQHHGADAAMSWM